MRMKLTQPLVFLTACTMSESSSGISKRSVLFSGLRCPLRASSFMRLHGPAALQTACSHPSHTHHPKPTRLVHKKNGERTRSASCAKRANPSGKGG